MCGILPLRVRKLSPVSVSKKQIRTVQSGNEEKPARIASSYRKDDCAGLTNPSLHPVHRFVIITGPFAVMRIMCSKCADMQPLFVTTVQLFGMV